ncbi:formylglycine-generating enzyme family protein [Solimicrobium silvestre]|uniref:Sulfatase-modifying factor enzyme-like domain-containing protein n=1 Tax=Solimicrobium silvestre TaxID=2099400 RepID=A0A2S9GSZ7_9BURK|nr:formylglycine-generating enzyme family protein [Solimicrobium silvestre]PRC90840.1 hypothetical protein S2091_4421 [Solimicrobium silvestre]
MKSENRLIFFTILLSTLIYLPSLSFGEQTITERTNSTSSLIKTITALGATFRDCDDGSCPEMVIIPRGTFMMGADPDSENGLRNEGPVHRVIIGAAFAIGKTTITQGQWKALMGSNPSGFINCGDTCPVENVSWYDAQDYINKLNQKTGKQYRLPSEAEWEYACRSGVRQEYCGSDNADSVAWHSGNSGGSPHPVATKQPNRWGVYDMSGNVSEWVEDCFNTYNAPADGTTRIDKQCKFGRVIRGGEWSGIPEQTRSASRAGLQETYRFVFDGFRVVRTLP